MAKMNVMCGVVATMLGVFPGPLEVGAQHDILDHSAWGGLLTQYVRDGLVDYARLKRATPILEEYLTTLRQAAPSQWHTRQEQLAFWINAYNASVVAGVLKRYPLKSVKSVGGFFDSVRYEVGGESLTLNQIEERSRALGDWRIHMALVCASTSCPPLRAEAYVPERLEDQLIDQTMQYLRDPARGLRIEGGTLWLSKIFDWYAEDFVSSARGGAFTRLTVTTLLPTISPYLKPEAASELQKKTFGIKFMPYDWSLNDKAPR